MSKTKLYRLSLILSALIVAAVATPSLAQNNRCAVSCNGTDNACYRACVGR